MAFTFITLHNLENEEIQVNAYHIMTMEFMANDSRKYTEIRLVNGEILNVKSTPSEIRTLISMNGGAAE